MDSDANESLQRLVHVHLQCNTSLRGTRKLRVAGWGLLPRPPPRHRKHYTGACAHACGHDIFCGSSSNRNTRPVTHATLCAKWPGNCCECLSHFWRAPELVLLAFYLSSGTDPQTPKGHGQTPRAQSRTNSLWHRHARARARARDRVHTNACPPAKDVYIPGSGLLALKGLIRFVVSLFCFSRVTSSFVRLPTAGSSATLPDCRRQQRPCWCPKPETPHSKP